MVDIQVENAIQVIKDSLIDPSKGLPEEIFQLISGLTPMVNVDLLIQNRTLGTLLTWRPRGNYEAGWHIPGGIIRVKEHFDQRLRKVALSELGVSARFDSQPVAIKQMIHPTATSRIHFVSFLYRTTLDDEPNPKLRYVSGTPKDGQWFWHAKIPPNIYESQRAYCEYINDYQHE